MHGGEKSAIDRRMHLKRIPSAQEPRSTGRNAGIFRGKAKTIENGSRIMQRGAHDGSYVSFKTDSTASTIRGASVRGDLKAGGIIGLSMLFTITKSFRRCKKWTRVAATQRR
jgi:hypothetical protein